MNMMIVFTCNEHLAMTVLVVCILGSMHPTQHNKDQTNLIMSSFALLNTYNYITSGQILDEYSVISEKCVVNMAGILYGYATI